MPLTNRIQIVLQKDQTGNYVSGSNAEDESSIQNFLRACREVAAGTLNSMIDTAKKFGIDN